MKFEPVPPEYELTTVLGTQPAQKALYAVYDATGTYLGRVAKVEYATGVRWQPVLPNTNTYGWPYRTRREAAAALTAAVVA